MVAPRLGIVVSSARTSDQPHISCWKASLLAYCTATCTQAFVASSYMHYLAERLSAYPSKYRNMLLIVTYIQTQGYLWREVIDNYLAIGCCGPLGIKQLINLAGETGCCCSWFSFLSAIILKIEPLLVWYLPWLLSLVKVFASLTVFTGETART